jgi:hypothetical protein
LTPYGEQRGDRLVRRRGPALVGGSAAAESLRARGGQIAGFGAVFLALIGGNAARILHESHGAGRTEIGVALIIGALGLVTSVAVAVVGVIQPRSYGTIAAREIATYRSDRFLNEPELWRVQVRSLRTLERATVEAQRNGNAAGKAMNTSLYTFIGGLLFTVTAVGILVVELI